MGSPKTRVSTGTVGPDEGFNTGPLWKKMEEGLFALWMSINIEYFQYLDRRLQSFDLLPFF